MALAASEVKALARILDQLDYYRLLHLKREASTSEVRAAFHSASRLFHPDHPGDETLRPAVEKVAKRVREAYSVLRNPRLRKAYDQRLAEDGGVRMQLSEASAAAQRNATEERQGRTPQGRQYFNLAQLDVKRGDLEAATRSLQTAITFEPGNEGFKAQLAEIREKLR